MSAVDSPWPTNLREALRRAALDTPDRGIAIFDGRGRSAERRSYSELYEQVQESAARLAAAGVASGQPVLVALPTSWDWMEVWFGLVMLGALPVASSGAGAMAAAEAQYDKIEKVMGSIGSQTVIGTDSFRQQARQQGFDFAADHTVTVEQLRVAVPARKLQRATGDGDDVAFLQLTSGSTGIPRAVMISHRAAIHNPVASCEAIGIPHGGPANEWADCMVSWLPLYHDMGLIGCLLLPMITGLDSYLFRPQTFLARPRLWLEHLGSHGVSFAPAPNFGYHLCLERIAPHQRADLDLSSWRTALTGAEMVRAETATAFCEAFEPFGFRPEAFMPCYGLAETTLAVTFDVRGEGVRARAAPAGTDLGFGLSEIVSTGTPIRDTLVRIVAPDRGQCPDGTVGEVLVKGPGVFEGYFNDPDATAETLRDGWCATGDLGFVVGGELYLTGRDKDLLIVHGNNIMPDEIERLADGVTGGGGLHRSAAFAIARTAAGEEAVLVVEVDSPDPERLAELGREIRIRIGRALGLPLADLLFVRRGRIPRTTSGKMQRNELRRRYLAGTMERL